MEPPNKGHVEDDINSGVLSFVERLSSFRGSKCIRTIGKTISGTSTCVLVDKSIILCSYLGGSKVPLYISI